MKKISADLAGVKVKMEFYEEIFPLKCLSKLRECGMIFRVQAFTDYDNYGEQIVPLCPYCGSSCLPMRTPEWEEFRKVGYK